MAYTGISMLVLWICLFFMSLLRVFILEQAALLLYAHVW